MADAELRGEFRSLFTVTEVFNLVLFAMSTTVSCITSVSKINTSGAGETVVLWFCFTMVTMLAVKSLLERFYFNEAGWLFYRQRVNGRRVVYVKGIVAIINIIAVAGACVVASFNSKGKITEEKHKEAATVVTVFIALFMNMLLNFKSEKTYQLVTGAHPNRNTMNLRISSDFPPVDGRRVYLELTESNETVVIPN